MAISGFILVLLVVVVTVPAAMFGLMFLLFAIGFIDVDDDGDESGGGRLKIVKYPIFIGFIGA
jgi:hypothetical protein